jgi:hypothetical protein
MAGMSRLNHGGSALGTTMDPFADAPVNRA